MFVAVGIGLMIPASSWFLLVVFAVIRGGAHGGILVDAPVMAKHAFGLRAISKTISFISAGYMVGAAIGPAAVGFAADYFDSYRIPLIVMAGLAVIAAAILALVKPVYWVGYSRGAPRSAPASA